MQFPKLLYTLCATVICGGILSAQADDNAAQAAARAAVLQKMQEMNGATDTNTPAPAPAPAAAVTPAPAVEPTPTTGDNPAQAAARAALIQQSVALDTQRIGAAPTPAAPAPVGTPAPVVPAVLEYHPIVGPALPISTDQQTRLQALDAKYYANQISPVDYFTQREAILQGQ
jgi:hypothetical protein